MNQPVFMLMGGRTKSHIETYYSRLYTRNLDSLQAEAAHYKSQGFSGMKLRCGYPLTEGMAGMKKNIEMVKLVRETVGDDVNIMLEAYMGFNFAYAKEFLKRLEPYNLRWAEELLLPDEIHNFAKLKKTTSIPLSGGSRIHSLWIHISCRLKPWIFSSLTPIVLEVLLKHRKYVIWHWFMAWR